MLCIPFDALIIYFLDILTKITKFIIELYYYIKLEQYDIFSPFYEYMHFYQKSLIVISFKILILMVTIFLLSQYGELSNSTILLESLQTKLL